ncbi:MAG: sigma-70 family RNA polymerase sigma factor [Acidobacteriia bacterium]|nr:sigma-70 family RNA polymerase sigma factor [Terriglobia bacterium]
MSHQTELKLQNGTATISSEAFAELHDRYRGRLLNSMITVARNREEAEDITATAFTAAFENRSRFRGDALPQTWLHAIAMNEARSRRRERAVPLESIEDSDALRIVEADETERLFEQRECCPRVWKALRQVPRLYRRVLIDRFVRGYSVKQIAKRQRIPLGTVLSRIFKAKQLLRAAWKA